MSEETKTVQVGRTFVVVTFPTGDSNADKRATEFVNAIADNAKTWRELVVMAVPDSIKVDVFPPGNEPPPKEYVVKVDWQLAALVEKVMLAMGEGWRCQGGVSQTENNEVDGCYAQAMVR